MMTSRQALPTIILVACMTALSVDAVVAQEEFQQSFEAFAVAMGTSNTPVIPPGVSAVLQINFTRWSTDEERNSLFAALDENGQEGLFNALQKQDENGWVRVTTRGALGIEVDWDILSTADFYRFSNDARR